MQAVTAGAGPLPPGRHAGAHRADWAKRLQWYVDKSLVWVPLFTATFFAKVALPPLGQAGISIAIPAMLAAVGFAVLCQRAVVDLRAMVAFLALMGTLMCMQLAAEPAFSTASLLLLAALHVPYVFRMAHPPHYARILDFFQKIGLILAVLGVAQYMLQFVVGPALAFPMENYFPKSFLVGSFNQQAPLSYGSTTYRANGMFMVEPSVFSQFMAFTILIELLTRKRWWFIALAAWAMLLSYSGTGVVLLIGSVLALLASRGKWTWLLALALGAMAFIALSEVMRNIPYLNHLVGRTAEFGSTGSSGFARFVGGYYMFEQLLWPDLLHSLVGFGAGSFRGYSALANFPASEMAIFKVIFEFGILGALLYFGFLGYCIFRSSAPFALRAAVGICLILSGNYFPFAHSLAFVLLVWVDPVYRELQFSRRSVRD